MRMTEKKYHQVNGKKKAWFEYVCKYSTMDILYQLGQIEDLLEKHDLDVSDLKFLLEYIDRAKAKYQEQDLILAQYRATEEELGIDLIKLIKCIRSEKGIWKKDFDGGLINTRCMLACYFGRWQIYDKENIYDLKDYGITWALTKEELE